MRLGRTLALAAAAGALFYVGFAAYSGFHKVMDALAHFAWAAAAGALALAALNYLLRFLKWELYLRRLGVRIPLRDSFGIFLSGFSLTVTPGKVGEVLKAYLLREAHGIPMARTAPIVVAERLTDLVALASLALIGVGALAGGERVAWVALALVGLAVACVASEKLAHAVIDLVGAMPVVGKLAPKLREFYASTKTLLHPTPLVLATLLSIVAWLCECVAFWLVLRGFAGAEASLKLCTFIYATMTIAGALSFLPGGLGVQEIGMVKLLIAQAHGLSEPTAAAATFITRLCTLWFAVVIGVVALVIMQRRMRVDLGKLERE
ncbi:MAG TPA: lysylphosphatidylglycerol synthase transmembrane domain-containing protein [Polyangia bacterium]